MSRPSGRCRGSDRPKYDPAGADAMDDHDHGDDAGRVTAPMQEFTTGQVGVGLAVLLVGLVLTFGLALGLVGI
ncbi:DUF7550 family protein [Halolamina litorea]